MGVNQSTVSRIESSHWQELRLGEIDAYLKAVRRPWSDNPPFARLNGWFSEEPKP